MRQRRRAAPPILTPVQIERICEACASWDTETRQWRGSVRNRLLWMLLAETGVRVGEALGLQHRDWHTGCGDTPFIEVVDRDHPHGVRAKSGYRRVYVSDQLDRLYGEYVWRLCEAGADLATDDFDATCVFVNLDREPRFAPWRPESVYDLVDRLRRQLSGQVPHAWTRTGCGIRTPRRCCCRGSCARGESTIGTCRRADHAEHYAHVTEDAEMRAAADWKAFTAGWRVGAHCDEPVGSARDRPARSGHDRLGGSGPRPLRPAGAGRLVGGCAGTDAAVTLRRVECPTAVRGAFCHDGTWRAGVDLSPLPEPMRREVAWCVFRIIELGGKIRHTGVEHAGAPAR